LSVICVSEVIKKRKNSQRVKVAINGCKKVPQPLTSKIKINRQVVEFDEFEDVQVKNIEKNRLIY